MEEKLNLRMQGIVMQIAGLIIGCILFLLGLSCYKKAWSEFVENKNVGSKEFYNEKIYRRFIRRNPLGGGFLHLRRRRCDPLLGFNKFRN